MKSLSMFQETLNGMWKQLGSFDTNRLKGMKGPCRRTLSDDEQLIIKLVNIKLNIRTEDKNKTPRIAAPRTTTTFACIDGCWEIERASDRLLRTSFGKSPDLEFFIQHRDVYHHWKIVNTIRDTGLPELADEKSEHETFFGGRAPDKDNLAYGKRCDVILKAGNNRRTLVEVVSRRPLSTQEIANRCIQKVCSTDKIAFVAKAWTKDAQLIATNSDGILLYTPVYNNNKIEFKKIK